MTSPLIQYNTCQPAALHVKRPPNASVFDLKELDSGFGETQKSAFLPLKTPYHTHRHNLISPNQRHSHHHQQPHTKTTTEDSPSYSLPAVTMPPIQVYTKSPINAAKASGITPQTAAPADTTTTTHPANIPANTTASPYQPQPNYTPTPTRTTALHQNPPPPQPGAVPRLPEATGTPTSSSLPPPPRAGAAAAPPAPTAAATLPTPHLPGVSYPPQMAIPPPQTGYNQRGTSTSTAAPGVTGGGWGGAGAGPGPVPGGYQQNVSASASAGYPSPYQGGGGGGGGGGYGGDDGEEEGILGSAMKFAKAAGEKLSAAESEVWKRINKE